MQLHAGPFQGMELLQRLFAGQHHYHAVRLGVAHGRREVQVVQQARGVLREEADGAPVLKVVFDVGIFQSRDFYGQAVQGVIAAAPDADGEPALAALYLAAYALGLRGLSEGRPFVFVFFLQ